MNDILIEADGTIAHIYDDDMRGLFAGEWKATRRVSNVEPADGGGWSAYMTMAGAAGVVLGPFESRAEALAAELRWLRQERGL